MTISIDEAVKNISAQIRHESLEHGFICATLSSIILYLIVMYYVVYDVGFSGFTENPSIVVGAGLMYAGNLILLATKHHPYRIQYRYLCSFLISSSFVFLALFVNDVWGVYHTSKTILLLGFFAVLMGWNANRTVLLIGIAPPIISYGYIVYTFGGYSFVDVGFSMIKFPVFGAIFYSNVHQFFASAESRFAAHTKTINQLEFSNGIDDLTQIKNRKAFNFDLDTAIASAESSNTPLSIIVLDIDYFKQYNDSLGHPAGDDCLKTIASILESERRRTADSVSRIGGEEFAIILPRTGLLEAEVVAKRLKVSICQSRVPHPQSKVSSYVTVSAGVAELRVDDDSRSFYKRADRAMYQAKVTGRNKYFICSPHCYRCDLKRENNNE